MTKTCFKKLQRSTEITRYSSNRMLSSVSFSTNMNSIATFPGHWQLFLASPSLSLSLCLTEERNHTAQCSDRGKKERKKGSFQKQSLFELWFLWRQRCGCREHLPLAHTHIAHTRTHLRAAVLEQRQPINTKLVLRKTPPHLPEMSNFRGN